MRASSRVPLNGRSLLLALTLYSHSFFSFCPIFFSPALFRLLVYHDWAALPGSYFRRVSCDILLPPPSPSQMVMQQFPSIPLVSSRYSDLRLAFFFLRPGELVSSLSVSCPVFCPPSVYCYFIDHDHISSCLCHFVVWAASSLGNVSGRYHLLFGSYCN